MQNLTRGFLEQRRPSFKVGATGNRHARGSMILLWIIISMSRAFAEFAQADGRPFEALTAEEQAWLDQNPDKLILKQMMMRPYGNLSWANWKTRTDFRT